ncbi:amidase family protein [Saccharibacillus sp. CPCC 101409]|uniref:amidase family protein n=1 Tax=Saccharibacillus sp. CPCC 101409 TaxID=3058041 RepID=UPI002670DFCF|nr:amidase family protein [Saccharibacillus sp. CPCC 101409]MDO3411160.1 amidase family protein [Saccharibacillus sp. CPCC 101409]
MRENEHEHDRQRSGRPEREPSSGRAADSRLGTPVENEIPIARPAAGTGPASGLRRERQSAESAPTNPAAAGASPAGGTGSPRTANPHPGPSPGAPSGAAPDTRAASSGPAADTAGAAAAASAADTASALKLRNSFAADEEVPQASSSANRSALRSNAAHDREEITDEDLLELTIETFKEKLQSGRWTCLQLTQAYIERIGRLDGELNAVLELNPDAAALAKQLDDNFDELGSLPLFGVPVLLKDNIDTADKMTATAGSLALEGRRAQRDAFAAARLREAGAVLLGKVNMTEWANCMSWKMPSGYSSRGGQTRNPYGDYPVGGSSTGSAAAVSANFALGAIGSETSGSIVSPASAHSVVGIKPTVGLISRSGVIPLSLSQDTLGPIARTVLDAALILEAMAFGDEADACTLLKQRPVSFLPERSAMPDRLKVGVVESYAKKLDPDTAAVFERALKDLERAGIEVRRGLEFPADEPEEGSAHGDAEEAQADGIVLRREFKAAIDAFLAEQPHGEFPANLGELIAFNAEHAERRLRYGQHLLEESEADGGVMDDEAYIEGKARGIRRAGERGIDFALLKYGVHALVFTGSEGSDLAARAGYPLVSVPAGYTESGQPVGLLLSGTALSDPLLIEIAHRYERKAKRRRPPERYS